MWIEQHKSGKVNFVERYRDPYTNKWKKTSVLMEKDTPRIRKEAQKILDDKIKKVLSSIQESDLTFGELYDEWYIYYKKHVKRTSWIKVEPMMKHIKKHIKDNYLIKEIDERLVYKLIDDVYTFGNLSLNYSKQIRTTLSLIMGYAAAKKYIKYNPVLEVSITPKKVEEEKKRIRIEQKYLEKEEVDLLINHLYSNKRRIRHARICEFLYLTGLRYGELQALQVKEYDGENIQVEGTLDYTYKVMKDAVKTTPKNTSSRRIVSLPEKAKKIIEDIILENRLKFPEYNDDSYIFLGNSLTPLTIHSFNEMLRTANKELNFNKKLTSHIFRHSHVSILSELNVPLKAIMERVGHSDAKTTLSIYNHVTKKAKDNLIKELNQL